MVLSLVGISCQDSLIEALDRGQRWPITKQNVKKFKPVHVSAKNDQAQCQRHRKH